MTTAGLTPGNQTIVYSYGDDLDLTISVSGLTLGTHANFIVRSGDGAGATTLLALTDGNSKATVNSGAGTVALAETSGNMKTGLGSWGDFPYWLQVTDSGGKYRTVLAGIFRVLEAHAA